MNTDLDHNLRVHADGRRLEIIGARVSDKGAYTCVGENIAGSTEWDFDVDVHGNWAVFFILSHITDLLLCYTLSTLYFQDGWTSDSSSAHFLLNNWLD